MQACDAFERRAAVATAMPYSERTVIPKIMALFRGDDAGHVRFAVSALVPHAKNHVMHDAAFRWWQCVQ